jgi:hypothetical protein
VELRDLVQIVWFMDDGVIPAVRIAIPEPIAAASSLTLSDLNWKAIEAKVYSLTPGQTVLDQTVPDQTDPGAIDQGQVVGYLPSQNPWQVFQDLEDLSTVLSQLPWGSVLELLTTSPEIQGAKQRYCGTLDGETWQIQQTYPAMTTSTLRAALDFAAELRTQGDLRLQDEEERQMLEEKAKLDWQGADLVVTDQILRVIQNNEPDQAALIMTARHCFRHRFGPEPWDFREVEAQEAALQQQMWQFTQSIQQISAQFLMQTPGKKPSAFGALLWQGKRGNFYACNVLDQDHVSEEDLALVDQEMADLGFTPLGELTCESLPGNLIRGYGQVGQAAPYIYGIAMACDDRSFVLEFYSPLQGKASLTTTTLPHLESLAHRKIYRHSYPMADLAELLAHHHHHLKATGRTPDKAPPQLEALAQAIDVFLQRSERLDL